MYRYTSQKQVDGWALPEMPALLTDYCISMDDKYFYFSNWLWGEVMQYEIGTNTKKPKFISKVLATKICCFSLILRLSLALASNTNSNSILSSPRSSNSKTHTQVSIGGALQTFGIGADKTGPTVVNGVTIQGGPQMIQLSLDGKRLYVSTSLFR